MNRTALVSLILVLIGLAAPAAANADFFDVAADFSATNNPNSPWSYGTSPTLGGAFSLLTHNDQFLADGTNAPIDEWYASQPHFGPVVYHNNNASPQTFGGSLAIDAGQYGVGPGTPDDVVTRWIAPTSGQFQIHALFEGMSFVVGATTDVDVLLNGGSLFSANVDGWAGRPYIATPRFGPSPDQSYGTVLSLTAGDTVDFVVGNGGDGQAFDAVGISAQIRSFTPTPEPTSLALFGLGVLCVWGYSGRLKAKAGDA